MAYDEFLADRIRHKFKELNVPFEIGRAHV